MTDLIRCPACRGAKKVPKLGGMIGECNTCKGKGNIAAVDKPKPVIVEEFPDVSSIANAVADCVPASSVADKFAVEVLQPVNSEVKVDGKKAIFKRKRA